MDNIETILTNHHNLLKERKTLKQRYQDINIQLVLVNKGHNVTLKAKHSPSFAIVDCDIAKDALETQLERIKTRLELIDGFFIQADALCKPDSL